MPANVTCVRLVPENLSFVSDTQDTEEIKSQYPKNHLIQDYDSFFVCPETGQPVYAMSGIVPYLSKMVVRVAHMEHMEPVEVEAAPMGAKCVSYYTQKQVQAIIKKAKGE